MGTEKRIWEIDLLRACAIVLMIIFHLVVDLKDFFHYNINYLSGFWYYVGKLSAILFILISGISSTFSRNNLKRGLRIFCWGMVLTFITYIYNPKYYIKFGILHLLGISMIFYHILNQYIKHANLKYYFTAGTIFIITGNVFSRMETGLSFLFPFGLINKKFSSLDFYPVCPWFGVFLYGTIIGKKIYAERKSIFSLAYHCPFISYISHHSLTIYLIHQPILLACLYIIHYIF